MEFFSLPFSVELYTWSAIFTITVLPFVHSNIFSAEPTAFAVFLVDFNVFLLITCTISIARKGCRESGVALFVIPSDTLFVYFDASGFFSGVVPI